MFQKDIDRIKGRGGTSAVEVEIFSGELIVHARLRQCLPLEGATQEDPMGRIAAVPHNRQLYPACLGQVILQDLSGFDLRLRCVRGQADDVIGLAMMPKAGRGRLAGGQREQEERKEAFHQASD
ncbi:MAG: hypothetical protein D6722_28175 [Bacteroidetes bacterium]|nr:MAG: hypothetical protein D6722_28175 [Bacteroidota bacterium]